MVPVYPMSILPDSTWSPRVVSMAQYVMKVRAGWESGTETAAAPEVGPIARVNC